MSKYAAALLFLLHETLVVTSLTTTIQNAATFHPIIPTKPQQHQFRITPLSSSNTDTDTATSTDKLTTTTTTLIAPSETKALFYTLADTTLRIDPSNGSCCRSGCSGCSYLDETTGDFTYEEYASPVMDAEEEERGGLVPAWIAPYDHSDVGRVMSKEAQRSKWSALLFCGDGEEEEEVKEVKKEDFERIIGAKCAETSDTAKIVSFTSNENEDSEIFEISESLSELSTEAMEALWGVLSPSPGLPLLTKSDIASSLKTLTTTQSSSTPHQKWGGAITYTTFANALQEKAAAIANGQWDGSNFVDYESMTVEELQQLIEERDMRRVPKIKKFMMEELRFFDEHGRQGKRHPVKRTLS